MVHLTRTISLTSSLSLSLSEILTLQFGIAFEEIENVFV